MSSSATTTMRQAGPRTDTGPAARAGWSVPLGEYGFEVLACRAPGGLDLERAPGFTVVFMTSGQPLKSQPLPRNRNRDLEQQVREPTLTIAQVSERTGLSHDTLRYYEKAGLIERVGRSTGNQRRYQAADLAWLEFLLRLRETGMSIADMQRFAALRAAGNVSVAARLAMLRAHRAELADRIRTLRRNAAVLDHKIDHYEQLLLDEHEHQHEHEQPGSDELT